MSAADDEHPNVAPADPAAPADPGAPAPAGVPPPAAPPRPLTPAEELERLHEQQLVRRLRRGDPQAFTTMVRLHQQRVFNLVYRMLGNRQEAEDVAQDVFVTVIQSVQHFRGDSKLSTWLFRVAFNHCKNRLKYLKRRSRHRGRPLDEIAESDIARGAGEGEAKYHAHIPRPDEQVAGQQLERIIQREIAMLDEEHRLLVVLRDIQGMSYQEIAEVTGLNVGTIKSRLHRARLTLKEALARHL